MEVQRTQIDKIPEAWKVVKLGDVLLKITLGQAPPSSSYNKKGKGITFVKVSEFGSTYPKKVLWTTEPIQESKTGEILLSVAGTIGLVNYSINCAIGRSVVSLKPSHEIDLDYLFYLLNYKSRFLVGRGSTQKIITKSDIQQIVFSKPPLPEQKKIAEILSTVDEAIQKSDDIIEKTERLKKGLMQQLLENKKWKFESLSNEKYFELIMGQSPPSSTYNLNKEGLPFYQGNADFGELYPKPRVYCNSPIKIAEKGDILISVRAPVGELNIADQKCCIGRGLSAIRIVEGNHLFYFYFLKYTQTKIQNTGQGSTFKAITGTELKRIKVPIPNHGEQRKIASILSTIDKKLELERKRKEKLERIKKGLMNDLLTGKKRVEV